ncbi:hypothetical protein AAC691_12825 [Nguyenibacter vanlangensis]|uniref:Uncharacterized protein n=1 Tax=Nguyenibacter vanlangensis TaxID=1216886 RepID=A0ABZ3D0C5_9PROT
MNTVQYELSDTELDALAARQGKSGIETREENINGKPTPFLRKSNGRWINGFDWVQFARLPRVREDEHNGTRFVIGTGIYYCPDADGNIVDRPNHALRFVHDGIDGSAEIKKALSGEVTSEDIESCLDRIQKLSRDGRHCEVSFELLNIIFYVAARDTLARLKEIANAR